MKKLKFGNLSSPRYTRSMTKNIGDITQPTTNKSTYFSHESSEKASKQAKIISKKRSPIKVEYEDELQTKPQTKTFPSTENIQQGYSGLPIKAEPDEVLETKSEIKLLPPEIGITFPIKTEYNDFPEGITIDVKPKIINGWHPKDWELMLSNIQEMRKGQTAPVDVMGCHKCSDPHASAVDTRFQALLALMLSSQTKDQVTYAAMQRLKSHGCTASNIINTSDEVLGQLIHPVGFWKKKVVYIKKTVEILLREYGGDIPKTIEDLCKLPGVGPKMGHICMQVAWGEVSGIGVDTHVHRISNRLGWVRKPTKVPEETRIELESWLPKERWTDINHILVGFGQEICQPLRPKCSECLNKNICPFGKQNSGGNSRKKKLR
ncbi:endonuclease III-like protein 1 [Athalia rosae]|uniref:endonuclease III-like protein 1 n=1 Tax=Athalia rosae TaxID=37344 RepID=UPI0020334B4E|nr:endonuclease III-like protein 1 [Athalia rosae]